MRDVNGLGKRPLYSNFGGDSDAERGVWIGPLGDCGAVLNLRIRVLKMT